MPLRRGLFWIALFILQSQHQQAVASFLAARRPAGSAFLQRQRHQHRSTAAVMTMAQGPDGGSTTAAVLLMSTTEDRASVGMAAALLRRGGWEEFNVPAISEGRVWRRVDAPQPLYMWQIQLGFLRADFLDRRWRAATGMELLELIYLSRHAAASGKPSLTIHPIGNPGQVPPPGGAESAERAEHGGIPGKCVPSSPRIAPLFRELSRAVHEAGLGSEFEVTLEATHHGPWHGEGVPCCFVEIGSKDEDWGREDAADLWAEVLERSLGLVEGGGRASVAPKAIVVGLGGGHYCPKINDLLRHRDDVLVGHVCASYAFKGLADAWQQGVLEAVAATKAALGDRQVPVLVYVDKKAFPAAQRNELLAFLDAQGLPYIVKENELDRVVAERAVGSSMSASG